MTDRRNKLTGLPLPPDLAELDAELSSIVIDERPSFGPELQAELEKAWISPAPRSSFRVRHAVAAAMGALLLVSLAAPQARAGLARLLPWYGPTEPVSVPQPPVTRADVTPPAEALDLVSDSDPSEPEVEPGVEIGFELSDNTYPELLDRAQAQQTIRDRYPRQLQEAGLGGLVTVRLWVEVDGSVDHVQIERGSGVPVLDRLALEMAPGLRFSPARRSGAPVGTWVSFDLGFEPSEDSPAPAVPSAIASPAPPEIDGYEFSEELFSGEYLTPPPTPFEGQELLREAFGDAVGRGGLLEDVAALLDGVPPAGLGPTQWRREAGAALEDAMRSAPYNPAPALALARIRRKQGLRDEARRLYTDAIWRALANSDAVSATFLADLYHEQGKIIQEHWLAWENLGRIAISELEKTDCRASGGAGARFASAQQLIGLNNLCPAEFAEMMAQGFEAIRPVKGERRTDMLASFSAAVQAVSNHPGANVEILLDLADRGRWGELLRESQRFIWESQGHPDGILLSGLALQRLGYAEEAMERFRVALDALPVAEARSLMDVRALMPEAPAGDYVVMNDAQRRKAERAFWSTRDPILTTEVNEREAEHLARAAYASLRFGDLESDAVGVLLRYGPPTSVRSVGEGKDVRTVFWDYGGGSNVTFRRPATSRKMDLTPESEDYLRSLMDILPERYGRTALREVRDLPGLVSQFRTAQGMFEIEVHSVVPEKMYGGPSDSLHVSIFLLDDDQQVVSTSRQRVAATAGDLDLRASAGSNVRQVVLEVYDDRLGFLAALREPVGVESPVAEDPRISDLLLVRPANPVPSAVRRTESWVAPLAEEIVDDATLGVIFELYGLPETGSSYSLQASLETADGGRIALYLSPAGAHEFRTTWRRRGDTAARVTEYVTVDLTEVAAGDYTLEVVATLPRELKPIRARRRLTVR